MHYNKTGKNQRFKSVFKTEKEILHLQVWQFDQYLTSRKPQWKSKNVKIFNILRGNKWQGKIICMYDYNHYVIICIIIILYVVIIIVNIIKCILKWRQNKYFLLVETLKFPPGNIREISKGYILVRRKTITHGISENHEVLGKRVINMQKNLNYHQLCPTVIMKSVM